MSVTTRTYKVGELVVLWITGMTPLFIGKISLEEPLRIKVTEEGPMANLKEGDFIIREIHTRLFQYDQKSGTHHFLMGCRSRGQKVGTGLSEMGVTDNSLRYLELSD